MPEAPHAPLPPPPSLWAKDGAPASESSPLVSGAAHPSLGRIAAPLPSIPARYSWFKARKPAMVCTVALLYLGILGKSIGDAALYATLPAVRAATGYPGVLTNLPAAGTLVYGVGKGIGVFTVSWCGGRNTMLVALSGGMMLFFFPDGRYSVMLASWCAFRLATSQVWGGFTMIVANWVDGADVGKTMGVLAISWELGTGAAEALFGMMLGEHGVDHWREPFYVTGFVNVWVWLLLFLFLHGTAVSAGYRMPLLKTETGGPHPLQALSVEGALRVFVRTARFWLILVSNSCILAALYTLYFVNVYAVKALGATDQQGATMLTYISIGTVSAVIIATLIYDAMPKLWRAVLLTASNLGFLGLSYAMTITVATGGMTVRTLTALGTFTAFCGGMGAYLPISIFQIHYGGPRHASTMSNFHDTTGIALSAYASYLAGNYVENEQYLHYWVLFTVNVAIATASLIAFAWVDFWIERTALAARVEPKEQHAAAER